MTKEKRKQGDWEERERVMDTAPNVFKKNGTIKVRYC
jgi:hypothetical protein